MLELVLLSTIKYRKRILAHTFKINTHYNMMPLSEPLLNHSESKADYPSGGGSGDVPRPPESGLSSKEAEELLLVHGYNELAEEERNPLLEFLGNFWGPMPIMIWLAIIIEGIPKFNSDTGRTEIDWADFIVLFVLQMCNGLVSWHEHSKAADAVQVRETLQCCCCCWWWWWCNTQCSNNI